MDNHNDIVFGLIAYSAFAVLSAVYAVLLFTVAKSRPKLKKILNAVFVALIIAGLVAVLIFFPTVSDIKDKYKPLSAFGMYIFSALLIAVIFAICILFGGKSETQSPTKSVAFAGVSVGLSFALSYIKLFSLPQGGSVTLASMLPIIIYSYAFGVKKGVFAGVIYGLLQFIQSPQVYEPMQVVLDYPVAFAGIGVSGMFKKIKGVKTPLLKFISGSAVGCTLRYIAHFLSGYYVFSSWAMEGYTALTWSLVYNLYVIAELGIIILVGAIVFSSKSLVKELDRFSGE